jgi:hypothetical protein
LPPGFGAAGGEDGLGFAAVQAADPPGHGGEVEPGERGGVEVGAQVVAGFVRPEGGVLDALLADRGRERVGAADGGRGVFASFYWIPAEGRRHIANVLGVENIDGAAQSAES